MQTLSRMLVHNGKLCSESLKTAKEVMSCQRVALLQCNDTGTSNCQWVTTSTNALACVSLESLMSLSQPGSHEEISLVTNLDLSGTSGVTRCTQSAYLNGTSGSDSFLRRTETVSMFQGCFESIDQFASSVRTTGQHLPNSLLDGPILCSQFWLRPCTHSERSMRNR